VRGISPDVIVARRHAARPTSASFIRAGGAEDQAVNTTLQNYADRAQGKVAGTSRRRPSGE
jgi:hypothetical protein